MIPVYNEERTLGALLEQVLARPEVGEVIAVDDGSVDSSWKILQGFARRDPRMRAFRMDRNRGKGAVVRWAIEELSRPFAVVQDADLEYDPRDYAVLLEPLLGGRVDAVYGVRGLGGQSSSGLVYTLGSRLLTFVTNVLFGCYLRDVGTGYKMLRTDLWKRLGVVENGFEIEHAVTARLLRLGYRIHEVPVSYYARGHAEGKKLRWRDGVRSLATLFRLRLRSLGVVFGAAYDPAYHRERQAELAGGAVLRLDGRQANSA